MPPLGQSAADPAPLRGEPCSAGRERLVDEELLLLREAIRLLDTQGDPGIAIREMLHLLSELLGLNRGRVVLPDPGGDTLSIRYAYGLTAAEIAQGRYRTGEGVTGRVMTTSEAHMVQDIVTDPGDPQQAVERETRSQETVAFIAVPIFDGRGVRGVLAVHRIRNRKRAFADDMVVLRSIATLIGHRLLLQHPTQHPEAHGGGPRGPAPGCESGESSGRVYQRVAPTDRQRIEQALVQVGGNKSRAAQVLGLTLRQFNYRYKVLGLG